MEKTIFIFEAEEGMVLGKNAVLPDGHLITPAGTSLTYDLIKKISDFHILEIVIEENIHNPEPEDIPSYFTRIKQSEQFKKFNKKYLSNITSIKESLNQIITSSLPIDTASLLRNTNELISESKNSLHLFDMLHSMREYDDITFVHSVNVALISSIIGQWLGCKKEEIEILTLSGLLHDIGKMLIPSQILAKPDKLTLREYDTIKTHVSLGYNKLKDQDIDTKIKEACLLHHERCDGSGYPFGIRSEKIPFAAKIISIADVYDAMTSNRIYRGSICPFEVIRDMEANAFNQFDPKYLLPFLNNVVSTYLHNDVKLSNGMVGEVILINQNDLSRPIIKCQSDFIDLSRHHEIQIVSLL